MDDLKFDYTLKNDVLVLYPPEGTNANCKLTSMIDEVADNEKKENIYNKKVLCRNRLGFFENITFDNGDIFFNSLVNRTKDLETALAQV